jgi:hypothetical protein
MLERSNYAGLIMRRVVESNQSTNWVMVQRLVLADGTIARRRVGVGGHRGWRCTVGSYNSMRQA